MDKEGYVYEGFDIFYYGQVFNINIKELIEGKMVMCYGQIEIIWDFMEVWEVVVFIMYYELFDIVIYDVKSDVFYVIFEYGGEFYCFNCDVVVGCDGFYGVFC